MVILRNTHDTWGTGTVPVYVTEVTLGSTGGFPERDNSEYRSHVWWNVVIHSRPGSGVRNGRGPVCARSSRIGGLLPASLPCPARDQPPRRTGPYRPKVPQRQRPCLSQNPCSISLSSRRHAAGGAGADAAGPFGNSSNRSETTCSASSSKVRTRQAWFSKAAS